MDEPTDQPSSYASPAEITPATPELRAYPFSFHGNGSEFFRIWIVNIALTVVTIGFYMPWARVRTRKYFYGNTMLNDRNFDYLANPIALLKGYIIVVGFIILFNLSSAIVPPVAILVFLFYLGIFPWLIFKSLRFKCHNSSYANVRLRFLGSCKDSYVIYLGFAMLIFVTGGLIIPYQAYLAKKYMFGNLAVGQSESDSQIEPGKFYLYYLIYLVPVVLITVLAIAAAVAIPAFMAVQQKALEASQQADQEEVVPAEESEPEAEEPETVTDEASDESTADMEEDVHFDEDLDFSSDSPGPEEVIAITIFIVFYAGFIFLSLIFQQFIFVKTTNYTLTNTTLGSCRLHSDMRVRDVVWIMFSNVILSLLTLGIFIPWAMVRLRKYRIEHMKIFAYGDLQEFVASKEAEQAAIGDAAADYLDFEIGF